jgi:hypothetical protein
MCFRDIMNLKEKRLPCRMFWTLTYHSSGTKTRPLICLFIWGSLQLHCHSRGGGLTHPFHLLAERERIMPGLVALALKFRL